MKQLELTVTLKKTNDSNYPYEVVACIDGTTEYPSWYSGKTVEEVMYRFYESFANENLRYWHMLEDK